jgi:putative lipoic acid-binding regulatory protein
MKAESALLSFPCRFPIKVFGRNARSFRDGILAVVDAYFGELDRIEMSEQLSREGRFLSLTVTVHARSREQLDALYEALCARDDVLMVL